MDCMALIDLIVKRIEKWKDARYIERSKSWPTALADIVDWSIVEGLPDSEDADKFQVQATLGLTVGERRLYGLLRSVGMIHGEARVFVASANKPARVTVRYDPVDLGEMIAAPLQDELPFDVRLP
jgi:hypothetical protein